MDKIVGLVSGVSGTKNKKDDDFCDRLNNRYTVIILVVFALVVTTQMYVGNAITCWAPVHFTGAHTKYATSYCWVKNTYYLPWGEPIPKSHETEKRQVVPYYQWIPFILLGQAVMFYLPSLIWNGLNQKAGVDADNILEAANTFTKADKMESRERTLTLLVNQFHRFLSSRKNSNYYKGWQCDLKHIYTNLCRPCSTRLGNYLVILYLVSKLFYIANVIGQLFVMNSILATEFNIYGFELFEYWSSGKDWTSSPGVAFPRVTFCDFNIRRLGNVHRYTVQCALPINMYNEKIYMFLWFWMVFVAAVTVLDFFQWLFRYFLMGDKIQFLFNHLFMLKRIDKGSDDRREVKFFYRRYLRQDGVFLLRLIGHNTNNITVTEITCALWDKYQRMLNENTPFQGDSADSYNMTEMEEKKLVGEEKSASDGI